MSENIKLSLQNSRRILIHNQVQFKKAEFSEFKPDVPGLIIINPPYGERLEDEKSLETLYQLMGHVLKTNCQDSEVFILSGNSVLLFPVKAL